MDNKRTLMSDRITSVDRRRAFIGRRKHALECELHTRRITDHLPPPKHWVMPALTSACFVLLAVSIVTIIYLLGDSITDAQWMIGYIAACCVVLLAAWAGEVAWNRRKGDRNDN